MTQTQRQCPCRVYHAELRRLFVAHASQRVLVVGVLWVEGIRGQMPPPSPPSVLGSSRRADTVTSVPAEDQVFK